MTDNKSWSEFRESGFLWWINMILHTFGWAIAIEVDKDEKVTNAYPVRTKFRGFSEGINDLGYTRISRYMKENAEELLKECE